MTASGEGRRRNLDRFYGLLDVLSSRLGGPRLLAQCRETDGWPERGVYFFFEAGETRENGSPRVVRVGTQAISRGSETTLWKRLSQHRGTPSGRHPGGGNHRGSIFRLHVGTALLNRDDYPARVREAWNSTEANAEIRNTEYELERAVSDYIGRMPFLWLGVADPPGRTSMRAYIEAKSIGLLSNLGRDPIDPPSATWLGRKADAGKVRESGLWNVNHVDGGYEPGFLDVMEDLVAGRRPAPPAPKEPAVNRDVKPHPIPTLTRAAGQMLLHDAILEILGDREMSFSEIASALSRCDLYRKRDGSRIEAGQISARVRLPQYAELFVLNRDASPQRVRARHPGLARGRR